MTYVAFLDKNSIVTQVVQAPDDGNDWLTLWAERFNCECVETAKDGSINHQYAAPGFTYYKGIKAFIEPAPYPSWVLNKSIPAWEPPVPMPADADEFIYVWDEETVSWKNKGPREILETDADCIDCD